ncbi:MAG: lamin tail domain-containing protein [Candidatus Falkowbacteria bacterium]
MKKIIFAYFCFAILYCFYYISNGVASTPVSAASLPRVIINELAWMGTASSSNAEWIELFNTTAETIDLTGWSLTAQDGTPSILLSGALSPNGYYLLERTDDQTVPEITANQLYSGALGNSGEKLELHDNASTTIDGIDALTGWLAGDNSTKQTLERTADDRWVSSLLPGGTPAKENSQWISVPIEPPATSSPTSTPPVITPTSTATTTPVAPATTTPVITSGGGAISTNDIWQMEISEILPNPIGSDLAGEFIELHNRSSVAIDLTNWKISVGTKQYVFEISTSTNWSLAGNGYLLLDRKRTKLVLPNDQGAVSLWSPNQNQPIDSVRYETAPSGLSFAKNSSGEWQWSETPTPGSSNAIERNNQPPQIDWSAKEVALVGEKILFDSSDTTDPEDDLLRFSWLFGDGASSTESSPEHAFTTAGKFTVSLSVSDGRHTVKKDRKIEIRLPGIAKTPIKMSVATVSPIIINEFLPNPVGEDADEEWIELFNRSKETVDLYNWEVDDAPGGSKPYRFVENIVIAPNQYYLVTRDVSNIALNNGGDEVRLFNSLGELADLVKYKNAKEGLSYARQLNGTWAWLAETTPGMVNQRAKTVMAKSKTTTKTIKKSAKNSVKPFSAIKAKAASVKTIRVVGKVVSLPGQLSSQYFYIIGNQPWQVYQYRKDFPELVLGNEIEVVGATSVINDMTRVKIASQKGITIVSTGRVVKPEQLRSSEVAQTIAGALVEVTGEVTKKTVSELTVDDGEGEVLVYLKTNQRALSEAVALGQAVTVAGVIEKSQAGVNRILPRGEFDIVANKKEAVDFLSNENTSTDWVIPMQNRTSDWLFYGGWSLGGMILLVVGWLIRQKLSKD